MRPLSTVLAFHSSGSTLVAVSANRNSEPFRDAAEPYGLQHLNPDSKSVRITAIRNTVVSDYRYLCL